MIFRFALVLFLIVSIGFGSVQAEEIYPELECPTLKPLVIAGAVIGAALAYEIITPNLPQQNGITFFTSIAVGGLAGGFAGAVVAHRSCRRWVSVTPGSVSVCWEF